MKFIEGEPPKNGRGRVTSADDARAVWTKTVEELRANAGKWAVIRTSSDKQKRYSTYYAMRRNLCIAVIRGNKVYACWPDGAK